MAAIGNYIVLAIELYIMYWLWTNGHKWWTIFVGLMALGSLDAIITDK